MNFGWTALISGEIYMCNNLQNESPNKHRTCASSLFFWLNAKIQISLEIAMVSWSIWVFFSGFTAWTCPVPTEVWHS
jgi:hypothetical protein